MAAMINKNPRPGLGPSHGTIRHYNTGCRCHLCALWYDEHKEKMRLTQAKKSEQYSSMRTTLAKIAALCRSKSTDEPAKVKQIEALARAAILGQSKKIPGTD